MILLDLVVVVGLVYLVYAGYTAGILREGIVLMATIVGITLAGGAYENLSGDIENFIDDQEDSLRAAYLALIGAVVLAAVIVSYLVKNSLTVFDLGSLNSAGGAILAVLKAVLLVEAVLVAFLAFPALGIDEAIKDSFFAQLLLDNLPLIKRLLPGEFDVALDSV